jgi:hypothetical protein
MIRDIDLELAAFHLTRREDEVKLSVLLYDCV